MAPLHSRGGKGEQCLWDYNLILEMNSSDITPRMETSRKQYDVPKVEVKGEGINLGCLPE